jgi:hypothetical protein
MLTKIADFMTSIEKHTQKYPRLKEYLELKELAIKEVLADRFSILSRRDYHLNSIQKELNANRELLLLLGHVVNEEFEDIVVFPESDDPL